MNINTIGGGPGGLYASLLLKKTHPNWDVTVYEQNPPDITYGWGIVFPDRALSNLADADKPSHDAITEAAAEWEPFDIHYEGERYRCGGHGFASMMRTDLLRVLQERCREVGVELQFETEVDDPEALAAESDLCLVADGIYSDTRERYADKFGTDVVEGSMPFSWFGTEKQFDALTHIFVENEDGIWAAHTYPSPTSTFIIDCDSQTWENADIDEMSEAEYLDYFEDVFADYLDGYEILSQQDKWRRFRTIRNENWSYNNMVLVGDAAHTAHYSIGSGTTLAMEDGIGLMETFRAHDDIDEALAAYESNRKPIVEALQSSAERSRIHFEHIRRFYDMPARQFSLHHLTRTGRITYESLKRRDSSFISAFNEWFAERTPGDAVTRPPARQPLQLGDVVVENRFVRAIDPTMAATDGQPSKSQRTALEAAAADKPGLLLTEPLAVSRSGRPTAGSPGMYTDEQRDAWAEALDGIPKSVTAGAHLVHAGPAAGREPPVFGAGETAAREDSWASKLTDEFPTPPRDFKRGAIGEELRGSVREQFGAAARRAHEAGFEYLQVHAGPNTLLGQYVATTGGSATDTVAFPQSVVESIRDVWPDGKPLGVTLPVSDRGDEWLSPETAIEVTGALANAGCTLVAPVDAATGDRTPAQNGPSDFADDMRNELSMDTMATVPTTSADKVNTLVATGRADLCIAPTPQSSSADD
jgi:anthraniloyl-CoA monooxygenase